MIVALLEGPERLKDRQPRRRLEQIWERDEKAAEAQISLERNDPMGQPARQKQRLAGADGEPARALQFTKCGEIESGATVHDVALYILESYFASFLCIPHEPELSTR